MLIDASSWLWILPLLNVMSGAQSQEEFTALVRRGVCVSWDGKRVVAPEGVVDENGFVDLTVSTSKKSD